MMAFWFVSHHRTVWVFFFVHLLIINTPTKSLKWKVLHLDYTLISLGSRVASVSSWSGDSRTTRYGAVSCTKRRRISQKVQVSLIHDPSTHFWRSPWGQPWRCHRLQSHGCNRALRGVPVVQEDLGQLLCESSKDRPPGTPAAVLGLFQNRNAVLFIAGF